MQIKWLDKNGFDPGPLFQRIESTKTIKEDGSVSFSGMVFPDALPLLANMITFPKNIYEYDRSSIINDAVWKSAKKGTLAKDAVLDEVKAGFKKYMRRRVKPYYLATSLSINRLEKIPRRVFDKNTVSFQAIHPTKISQARESIIREARHSLHNSPPNNYMDVTVRVNERTNASAFEAGIRTLDVIRCIWNYFFNSYSHLRFSSGKHKPVNSIVIGPIHTIHNLKGEIENNQWWFEPTYAGPINTLRIGNKLENLIKFEIHIRDRFKRIKYSKKLISIMIRYVRALDEIDLITSFTRLWSVLESLTNTTAQDSYDVTIRRVLFLINKNRDYHKQKLLYIRDYRNRTIHSGEDTKEKEHLLFTLKYYVGFLLEIHWYNYFDIESLTEFGEFLSSPSDINILKRRINWYSKAVEHHGRR